jgi:hypothetical protein
MRRAARLLATLVLTCVTAACGPTGFTTDPSGDGAPDAGATTPVPPPPPSECDTDPASRLGGWCEFAAECCEGQVCLSAQCAEVGLIACTTHDDCPVAYLCVEGTCQGCASDLDCGPFAVCIDGVCEGDTCPDTAPAIAGVWDFDSRLNVTEAVSDFVLTIGDAAAEACDWIDDFGFLAGLPAWAPDLICLIGDIVALMHDMEVEHTTTIVDIGPVTWSARDHWDRVVFDPDGDAIAVDPDDMECPITVDNFEVTYSCGLFYLDRHEVHLAVNGLVMLLLDAAACIAMDHAWGCGWDAALDQVCAGIDDPFLRSTCEGLLAELVIPDPCFSPTTMTLAGTALPTGPDALVGDWAGTLGGDDFTGTFTANR